MPSLRLRDGVLRGEHSGAGKTVSAKYIMRYFATVDDPEKPGKRKVREAVKRQPAVEAMGFIVLSH